MSTSVGVFGPALLETRAPSRCDGGGGLSLPGGGGFTLPTDWDLSPLQLEVAGVSGLTGFTAGYAAKRTFKVFAFTAGCIFSGLQVLAHNDLITIHWDKMNKRLMSAVDLNGDGKVCVTSPEGRGVAGGLGKRTPVSVPTARGGRCSALPTAPCLLLTLHPTCLSPGAATSRTFSVDGIKCKRTCPRDCPRLAASVPASCSGSAGRILVCHQLRLSTSTDLHEQLTTEQSSPGRRR